MNRELINQQVNKTIIDSVTRDFIVKLHQRSEFFNNNEVNIASVDVNAENIKLINEYNKKSKRKLSTITILENIIKELANQEEVSKINSLNDVINQLGLTKTANSNYMVNANGNYFRIMNYEITPVDNVIDIDKDGNYTIVEKLKNSNDMTITKYDINNKVLSIKITNSQGNVYMSEKLAAKKLNLKKEYVNKYKIHGFCGSSCSFSELTAAIGNFISASSPSGCYADSGYRFFKWNSQDAQFEINSRQGSQIGAPLIADYKIIEDRIIRTDYDGAGMI